MTESASNILFGERRRSILLVLAMLLPLGLCALFIFGGRSSPATRGSVTDENTATANHDGRLILVIVDSLRRQAVDELMPNLKALSQQSSSTFLDVHTASGNMSLPCIQTLLEGRESPYASAIHNFTGEHGPNNASLPAVAATAGLRPALIADFIILGLYRQYGAITVNRPDLARSELACDLAAIDKAADVLSDKGVRLVILHVGGTDAAAHRWNPGHPEYVRHFREVDAKLWELIGKLDLKSDQLIVTGDHGHNERGNHVPWSVAMFAGGIYPELFAAVGPVNQLEQVDMLFLMDFPQNLPLPINYEGRYFGIETPLSAAASPEIRRRFDSFRNLQAQVLNVAPENLGQAIANKRAQVTSLARASLERTLPLLVLFLAWITVAFRINDSANSAIWSLLAIALLAIVVWLIAGPISGLVLAIIAGLCLMFWAIKAGEFRRLCFLLLLLAGAGCASFNPERSQRIFSHNFIIVLLATGAVIVLLRGGGVQKWPAAFCAVVLFVLPSSGFKVQLGPAVVNAWFLGAAITLLGLIVTRRVRQIRFPARSWIALCVLLIAGRLLRAQRSDIGRAHNLIIDWINRHAAAGLGVGLLLYFGCASYLVWSVRRRSERMLLAAALLVSPIYCSWFAKLPVGTLAVVSLVPVFFAAWLTIFDTAGPLKDQSAIASERSGLFLATTLVLTFWMLFQGFFIQEIDFSFALKYLPEKVSGLTEMVVAFPLTFLKYALPVIVVVFVYVGFRGALPARRAIIAGLIFCNLKLAALLTQIFVGPLGTQQKFYELAMSDFVFVSQLLLIAGLTYLGLILRRPDSGGAIPAKA